MTIEQAVIDFGIALCVIFGAVVTGCYVIAYGVRAAGRMIRGRS